MKIASALCIRIVLNTAIGLMSTTAASLVWSQTSASASVTPATVTTTQAPATPLLEPRLITGVSWDKKIDPLVNTIMEQAADALINRQILRTQIAQLEAELTKELRDSGFLIGQIVVSSKDQAIFEKTGALHFSIFLGKIGEIVVKNTSTVNNDWVKAVIDKNLCPNGVGDDCALTKKRFERMTQLLYDIVGLQTGTLEFSAQGMPIGQTQLTVTTAPKDSQIKSSVGADNYGFSSTGQFRLSGSVSANNLFGVGDVLALNIFTSNQGSVSGALNVSGPLAANGLRWQTSVSRTQFDLPNFSNTKGFGNALSLGVAYPLVRGLDRNWTAGLNAVGVATYSETMGVNTANKTLKSGQLTLEGNSGDRSINLGQNSWFFNSALTMGEVTDSANTAASSYAPLGAYTKLAFQGVGKVILNEKHSIFAVLNVRGQIASKNLDPYERMLVGGATALRAYSVDQGSINQGAIITAELRKTINTNWGQFTPVVFVDYLNGQINHTTYPNWQTNQGYSNPNLSNHLVAADAGLGLDWNYFNQYSISVSWAKRLPTSPSGTYGNGNSQFWFVAQARF